ncbi:MAG: universal stress protein [Flavobacteriales bacterium]|jgi:nucleotide-binding universal stress UspA family protein
MAKHCILVPMDFTSVSDIALEHAFIVGKAFSSDILLLHIIGSKKEMPDARKRMEGLLDRLGQAYPFGLRTAIRIGSIFEDIDDVAVEQDADLVIMGTHGLKGMQFITGGRSLRIVTNCSTPFIITQEKSIRESGYDDIVVPLDLHQDTKQKLSTVSEMAAYFKGRVHIISPAESDEFLRNQLLRNIEFAKEYLTHKKIEFTVKISEHSSSAFVKDVIRYAAAIEADLISIMNLHEKSLMGILGQSYEQQIITNEAQVPVLVINPIETRVIRGSVFAQ